MYKRYFVKLLSNEYVELLNNDTIENLAPKAWFLRNTANGFSKLFVNVKYKNTDYLVHISNIIATN